MDKTGHRLGDSLWNPMGTNSHVFSNGSPPPPVPFDGSAGGGAVKFIKRSLKCLPSSVTPIIPPVSSLIFRHTCISALSAKQLTRIFAPFNLGSVSTSTSPGSHVESAPTSTTAPRLPGQGPPAHPLAHGAERDDGGAAGAGESGENLRLPRFADDDSELGEGVLVEVLDDEVLGEAEGYFEAGGVGALAEAGVFFVHVGGEVEEEVEVADHVADDAAGGLCVVD